MLALISSSVTALATVATAAGVASGTAAPMAGGVAVGLALGWAAGLTAEGVMVIWTAMFWSILAMAPLKVSWSPGCTLPIRSAGKGLRMAVSSPWFSSRRG